MPFTEDLRPFFDPAGFGSTAQYVGVGFADDAPSIPVNGIFDDAFALALGLVEDSQPRFTCAASSIASPAHGDELTLAGVTYRVTEVQPDGTGVLVLRLQVKG